MLKAFFFRFLLFLSKLRECLQTPVNAIYIYIQSQAIRSQTKPNSIVSSLHALSSVIHINNNNDNLCADQIETSTSPPPRANPGYLTIFCARGVGNLTDKAFPGVGNLTLPGWGGEN